ncbi:hypothetical protein GCM10023334_018910 [Nonomuraea thailandensis]
MLTQERAPAGRSGAAGRSMGGRGVTAPRAGAGRAGVVAGAPGVTPAGRVIVAMFQGLPFLGVVTLWGDR